MIDDDDRGLDSIQHQPHAGIENLFPGRLLFGGELHLLRRREILDRKPLLVNKMIRLRHSQEDRLNFRS